MRCIQFGAIAFLAGACQQQTIEQNNAASSQDLNAPPARLAFFPSWSPDGSQIAFVSDRDENWEIYVMNADGSGPSRLTRNTVRDSNPHWSPDGSRLFFYSDLSDNREVYVMEIDGGAPENLTNHPTRDGVLAVSPNGSKVAWYTERDGNGEIYIMLADGSDPVNVTNH